MKKIILAWICLTVFTFNFEAFSGDNSILISNALSPKVSMAVTEGKNIYTFEFDVENPYAKVTGRLMIGAKKGKIYKFAKFPAKVSVKKSNVVDGRVLMGLEVSWFNADGSLRQREVFNSSQVGGLLPRKKALFSPFDLQEYFTRIAREKLRILIPVEIKDPSKVTLVLSEKNGRRVRNLVSGIEYPSGKQKIEWDGRTDYGTIVAPGTYNYKLMTHPGLSHELLMQFANGGETKEKMLTNYGPNHNTFQNLCDNEKYIFAVAANTEGGNALVAMNHKGDFVEVITNTMEQAWLWPILLQMKNVSMS